MRKRSYRIAATAICLIGLVYANPCRAYNNPLADEKLFHWGFQLGLNFMTYGITDSNLPIADLDGKILHARVSGTTPGFCVGFVTDLRLSSYLNLRFTPGLEFASRTLTYSYGDSAPGEEFKGYGGDLKTQPIPSIPFTIPVYLKWSAKREKNYRPYVIVGGGISLDINAKGKNANVSRPVRTKVFDGFVEGGFGCDIYFPWFKFCPQLTYRVGFANQIVNINKFSPDPIPSIRVYTQPIDRMVNRAIVLILNFDAP